jgi:tetratricopeptide (TPR) repeat protein
MLMLPALASVQTAQAQDKCKGFNWPEDPAQRAIAEEKNVLYTDALRNDNFKAAQGPHLWFLKNKPDFSSAIYINGAKIYSGLVEQTEDEAQKNIYIDSLMLIYDMRREYCNEAEDVMARKAYDSYKYTIRDTERLEENLRLFDEAFELNKDNLPYYMMLPYMNVVRYNAKIKKNLSETEILDRYTQIIENIDRLKAAESDAEKVAKLEEIQGAVDAILIEIVNIDCDFVKSNLEPKFKANPTDLKLAKQIFKFMLEGKCTDDPLWLEAGEVIAQEDPSFGLYKNLAIKAQQAGDMERAENLYNKAIEYAKVPSEKADIYTRFGSIRAEQGRKAEARSMFYKALEADPSDKSPYNAIGYLYFGSYDQCKGMEDQVKDRAIFLAAYDMFIKGGNTNAAAKAKEQFPSKEEIFTRNYEAGQSIDTGCWVGESTVIRTRD